MTKLLRALGALAAVAVGLLSATLVSAELRDDPQYVASSPALGPDEVSALECGEIGYFETIATKELPHANARTPDHAADRRLDALAKAQEALQRAGYVLEDRGSDRSLEVRQNGALVALAALDRFGRIEAVLGCGDQVDAGDLLIGASE